MLQNYLQIFDWMPKKCQKLSKNFSRLDSSFVLKNTCIAHCWKSVMVIKSRCKTIRVYFSTFSWFFFCSTNLKHFTAFENCANNNVKWKWNFFSMNSATNWQTLKSISGENSRKLKTSDYFTTSCLISKREKNHFFSQGCNFHLKVFLQEYLCK